MSRYLHIGCGDNILPDPFENLDDRELAGLDHKSLADDLSKFKNNTFDLVYSSHVLEHFQRDKTEEVLSEWARVTKKDGTIRLSVPSFENLIKIYNKSGKIENVIGPLMGGQTYGYNFHYNLFDEKSLKSLMEKCGLTAIHPWLHTRTEHSDYFDFSQAVTFGIPISLNLEGRKK